MPVRVFVSYSNDDVRAGAGIDHVALALTNLLGVNGVFHDRQSIALGSDWRAAISKGLEQCDALVFMLGPALASPDRLRRLIDEDDVLGEELRFAQKMNLRVLGVAIGTPPLNKMATDLPASLRWLSELQWIECGSDPTTSDLAFIKRKTAEAIADVALTKIVKAQYDYVPWVIDTVAGLDAAQIAAMQVILPDATVEPRIRRAIAEVLRLRGFHVDPGPDTGTETLELGIALLTAMQGQSLGRFDRKTTDSLRLFRRQFTREFGANLFDTQRRRPWTTTGAHTETLMIAADRNVERAERLHLFTATRMHCLAADADQLPPDDQAMLARVRSFLFGEVIDVTPSDYLAFTQLQPWQEVRRR